jgi:insulysin
LISDPEADKSAASLDV